MMKLLKVCLIASAALVLVGCNRAEEYANNLKEKTGYINPISVGNGYVAYDRQLPDTVITCLEHYRREELTCWPKVEENL
jgi:hypothetical protein